uniref:Uncharacterized protein n=1 Tax=Arion vulgaris TaxID=1028688 RepID=A0A0B7AGC6_9EUPU
MIIQHLLNFKLNFQQENEEKIVYIHMSIMTVATGLLKHHENNNGGDEKTD